jgi:transposase
MRRIRDCLRLFYENKFSQSQISNMLGISRSTVQEYLSRLTIASMSYEDIRSVSDADLESALYHQVPREIRAASTSDKEPDYKYIHTELAKSGVTLRLLWEEYKIVASFNFYHIKLLFS